jgi:hypothetical protein
MAEAQVIHAPIEKFGAGERLPLLSWQLTYAIGLQGCWEHARVKQRQVPMIISDVAHYLLSKA